MNILTQLVLEILPPDECISVIDCGAKGGSESAKWLSLGNRVVLYGFDPDQAECERLNAAAKNQNLRHTFYPYCLGTHDSEHRNFYLTKQGESHSLYEPNEKLLRRWKSLRANNAPVSWFEDLALDRVVTVNTTSLDTWAKEHKIPSIDFVKLDVQGAELDILAGAKSLLPEVLGMEVETEFNQLYVDQPLFADVDTFARRQGFTFFQFLYTHTSHFGGRTASPLNLVYEASPMMMRQMSGQLLTADALYFRDLVAGPQEAISGKPVMKAMKLACIAETYGQIEFAIELLVWARDLARVAGESQFANSLDQVVARGVQAYATRGSAR